MGEVAHKYDVPTKLAPREAGEKDVMVDLNNLRSPADVYPIDPERYKKSARTLNLLDQSSAPTFVAGMSADLIENNACVTTGGGGCYAMTVKAYKDTLPAFSEQLSYVSKKVDKDKLFRSIESFLTYQAIMTNRAHKDNQKYAKFGGEMDRIVTPGMTSQQHIDQLNNLLQKIVFNLKDAKLKGLLDAALTTEGVTKEGDEDQTIQAIKNFMAALKQQDPNVIFGLVNDSDIYRGPEKGNETKVESHDSDKKVKGIISRLWKRIFSVFREAA